MKPFLELDTFDSKPTILLINIDKPVIKALIITKDIPCCVTIGYAEVTRLIELLF